MNTQSEALRTFLFPGIHTDEATQQNAFEFLLNHGDEKTRQLCQTALITAMRESIDKLLTRGCVDYDLARPELAQLRRYFYHAQDQATTSLSLAA